MKKFAVKVETLGKVYRIRRSTEESEYSTLREKLSNFEWLQPKKVDKSKLFWALKDVSFMVEPGDVLGIIGPNGAGKSTLLKILSRITAPTLGRIELNGNVSSLLEVGTGFHPELTGEENIYLSGTILGLRRVAIKKLLDEIIAFAGVEEFVHTPVKRYSSGMKVRLGFAVAAFLNPEILIIDEVLAVGDLAFQKKCLGRIDEVAKGGRTVLFVSHNLGVLEEICNKGLLLRGGNVVCHDNIQRTIQRYTSIDNTIKKHFPSFKGPLSSKVDLSSVNLNRRNLLQENVHVSQLDSLHFRVELLIGKLKPFRVTLSLFCQGSRIFSLHDDIARQSSEGAISAIYKIPSRILRPGLYQVAIGGLENNHLGDWFWHPSVCSFFITEQWDASIEPINHGLINMSATCYRIDHDS